MNENKKSVEAKDTRPIEDMLTEGSSGKVVSRICKRCKRDLPVANFGDTINKTYYTCIECRDKDKEYRKNNKDKVKNKNKNYRENNIEKVKKINVEYRKNNRDIENARLQKWREKNPDRVKELDKKYREKED